MLVILCNHNIYSQFKQQPVVPYQPWQLDHPAIDYKYTYFEPDFVTDSSDGYNCFLDTPIRLNHFDGKYLYYAFAAKTDFDVEGYFLTKFNVETGKEEWRRAINMRNQENREMPVAIKVENNSILVASLEKRTEYHPELQLPFYWLNSMSGMVLRNFDKNSGHLLSYVETADSIYSYGLYFDGDKYSVSKFVNNKLLYIGNDFMQQFPQTKFIQLDTSNLQIIKSDSLIQNIPNRYVINKNYSYDYDFSVGLFGAKYDYISKTFLGKFDLSGNLLMEKMADTLSVYSRGLSIIYVDNSRVILSGQIEISPFELPREFVLIYNHDLELIQKIELPYRDYGEGVVNYSFSDDSEYILFSTISKDDNFNNGYGYTKLHKYDLINNVSKEVFELPFTDSLRYAICKSIFEFDSYYLMVFDETSLYFDSFSGIYKQDADARATTILRINKIKLLGVQDENYHANINYFPNPVSNVLWLDCDPCPSSIIIYNSLGQMIYQGNINDKQIDVSHLMPGMYFITSVMDDNQFVTNKFIRISD